MLDSKVRYPDKYWDAVKYYYDCIFGPFAPYVREGLAKIAPSISILSARATAPC
jgi:flavorubredoxin